MAWKITADVIVVVHFLWILFIICGALIGRWVRWVKWLHVGALAFSVCLQLFQWTCPLTHLEVWLRQRHNPALGYVGDFLAHYAERLVYLPAPRGCGLRRHVACGRCHSLGLLATKSARLISFQLQGPYCNPALYLHRTLCPKL